MNNGLFNSIEKSLNKIFFLKNISRHYYFFFNFFIGLILITFIYILIPKFFDYDKKKILINDYFNTHYNINLKYIENISYSLFPTPRINLKNVNYNFISYENTNSAKNISLKLNLGNLINYKKINVRNILILNSVIDVEIEEANKLFQEFLKNKKNIKIKFSDLNFKSGKKNIFSIKDINLDNFDKKKLDLNGFFLKKEIKINYKTAKEKNIFLVLIPEAGTELKIFFNNSNYLYGMVKSKILNSNIKFNFDNKRKDQIKIDSSYFRSKSLNATYDSKIILKPNFFFETNLNIKNVDIKHIYDLYKEKLLSKNNLKIKINKKINGILDISYYPKKIDLNKIKNLNTKIKIENGNIFFKNLLLNYDNLNLSLNGSLISKDDNQKLIFYIDHSIEKKNKTFKKKYNYSKLKISGILNLNLKKIQFIKFSVDDKEKSLREIEILEKTFNTISKNNLLNILNIKNIKQFTKSIN